MSWRTTAILFIVLVLVGGLVYLQSRQDDASTAAPTALATTPDSVDLFAGVDAANVVRLDVRPNGDTEASFTQEEDGGWFMTVPTATTVISQTVTNSLMGLINTGSRRTFTADENPLDVYGLVEPTREVVFAVRREEQLVRYRLQVGNETPAGDAYYVLKEGDQRVHLLTKSPLDSIFELATQPPLPETLPTPMSTIPITDTTPAASLTPTTPITVTIEP